MVQGSLHVPTSLADAWNLTSQVIGNVIAGAVVFVVVWLLARLVRNLVSRTMARRGIRSDAALLTTRFVYVGMIGLGGFMFVALSLGSGIVGVTGVLVAAVLTSLGLQDLVKNYVSGFYVLMEKNVRVGDLVESGGYRGLVTDIRMRVTYLRGARGEMIVVPNGELFNRTLVISEAPPNWAISAGERRQDDPDQGVEVVAD
jgi:small-conductance mechanosensitive channel